MNTELTPTNIFELGRAWSSFVNNEIDEGIHSVLPTGIDEDPSMVFMPLFKSYFDRIPRYDDLLLIEKDNLKDLVKKIYNEEDNDGYGYLHAGAIEKFCKDIKLNIKHEWRIQIFDEFISGRSS